MSIRKKVANLWAPLLQSKGNSTTQPMSQKAVSDELSQLKSDLDGKINYTDSLTFEEIQASTPPLDLDVAIPKASALKNSIKNRPLASYYYSNISSANRESRYNAIVELRTLTTECFNRGSIVHIPNNTGGYHTYIIGSTDPDYFVVLPLTYYSDPRLELYKYSNGNWTRYYASMTQF